MAVSHTCGALARSGVGPPPTHTHHILEGWEGYYDGFPMLSPLLTGGQGEEVCTLELTQELHVAAGLLSPPDTRVLCPCHLTSTQKPRIVIKPRGWHLNSPGSSRWPASLEGSPTFRLLPVT